jgi:PAS domain S-box-containing protein
METITTRHNERVGTSPDSPPAESQEATFAPPCSVGAAGDEVEARTHQLSLLVEVSTALSGAFDVESVLGTILSRLTERQRLCHARIFQLDGVPGELRHVASGGKDEVTRTVASLQANKLLASVVRHREAVYVPQADKDPRCQEEGFGTGERCVYVVPLQTGTRLLGVLEAASDRIDSIRSVTRKLIDQVANQVTLALERHELYKLLRVSEERFRSIFEQAQVGVALTDLEGHFTAVNAAFASLLGHSAEELLGKHFKEFTAPQDMEVTQQAVQSLLEDRTKQVRLEKRYRRKSGELVWCATSISLLRDTAGRPAFFLGMAQDIDERKRAEEDRRRLQEQFFEAQKMETLGTLAGGIAHDFNNLLNVMLGFASLARRRLSAEDPLRESIGMIEEAAQRAAELTRQLLGFSRPELHQVTAVSVNEVLSRVSHIVAHTFDRIVTVVIHKSDEAMWVNAEPSYLEQALLNICINARDAMAQGGTLTLEAAATPFAPHHSGPPETCAPGRYAQISIQDTGVGIAPEALPRIFDPFFTTKDPDHGTGLGLAMVRGFVKSHGGCVKVESDLGHGSRFTIFLPLVPAPSTQLGAEEKGQIQFGRGTVLVVDDEPLVRAFAEEGLKGLGYDVWVAENGKTALETYERHHTEIDCVLMDLIMPQLSGVETYRRMRAMDPLVRVVFASGYSTGEILRDAPDARSATFIGKPYTLEGLSLALRKAWNDQPR